MFRKLIILTITAGCLASHPHTVSAKDSQPAEAAATSCNQLSEFKFAKIAIAAPKCKNAVSPKDLSLPSAYIHLCKVAQYKTFLGKDLNDSDTSHVEIKVLWPTFEPIAETIPLDKTIVLNLFARSCHRDYSAPDHLLESLLNKKDSNGKEWYRPQKFGTPGMKKYKALAAPDKNDIYVAQEKKEKPRIIRCGEARCVAETRELSSPGYSISYSFNARLIAEFPAIDKRVLEFLSEKFR